MGIAAALAGKGIGALGVRPLAPQAMNLALLVQSVPRFHPLRPRRGAARFLDGLGPSAAELHDLGAMDQTRAGKGHELRLRLTPPAERHRPFPRAIERVAPLASSDRVTVDQPRDDG